MKNLTYIILMFISSASHAQDKTDAFLKDLLLNKGSAKLRNILQHPDSFRYQIIYTRIDRDKLGQPHFKNFYYRVNKKEYFNPASTVKMPLAFLALEKIHTLSKYGIDKNTPMLTDSAYPAQSSVQSDTSAQNGLPSIAQYIRKIFLISDNDAYNRLYEFLGQSWINRRLWAMGYKDIRITRRFVPMNEDQNRHTNPIHFTLAGKLLYQQPPEFSELSFDFSRNIYIGHAHWDSKDSLVNEPMDFTMHNNLPLEDLQKILQSELFPSSVDSGSRFNLDAADHQFLNQYMSEYPSESSHPSYDTTEYFDAYTKFFMFKSGRSPIPSNVRIFNKPGWSYGFLTDAAYVADFSNKVEFMLTAVIYVNRDGVLNDNKYEYEETGYPFFKELGNLIYDYELKRKRRYFPDLSLFVMHYE